MMFQLITYNSEVTELIFMFRADDTETNMSENHLYHVDFFLKGTMELLKSSLRGKIRLQGRDGPFLSKKTGQLRVAGLGDGLWRRGAEGERESVKSAPSQESLHFGNKSSLLSGPASPRLPTWLRASRPTSPCSLSSVLRSVSICCWLPTCCLGNPRILRAELRGSGTFHSYLNQEKQAAGWEESGIEELCWSNTSCRARPTLRGRAAGLSGELLDGV